MRNAVFMLLLMVPVAAGAQEASEKQVVLSPACFGEQVLRSWSDEHLGTVAARDAVGGWGMMLGRTIDDFGALCRESPRTYLQFIGEAVDGKANQWLPKADQLVQDLHEAAIKGFDLHLGPTSMTPEQQAAVPSWTALKDLQWCLFHIQDMLTDVREVAYRTGASQVREIVREVPVPCPEEAPEPMDPCEATLRSRAAAWGSQLREWTSHYQGSGEDWQLANNSGPELLAIGRGESEPAAYMIEWLAVWHSIRRRGEATSFLGPGPIPAIAVAMRTQLGNCGYHVSGRP